MVIHKKSLFRAGGTHESHPKAWELNSKSKIKISNCSLLTRTKLNSWNYSMYYFSGYLTTMSIFYFNAFGMDLRVQAAVKSILWEISFLDQLHNCSFLSSNSFSHSFSNQNFGKKFLDPKIKTERVEKLLGFARSHSIVTRGSVSLSCAATLHSSFFSES